MDEAGIDRAVVVPPGWPGDRNDYGIEAARRYPNRFAGPACSLGAAYVPFARTKEERVSNGDPRPSIRERYKDLADYKDRIEATAQALMASGFLLPADAEEIITAAATVVLP